MTRSKGVFRLKKTVICTVVALLAGFALGIFCGSGVLSGTGGLVRATASAADSPLPATMNLALATGLPAPTSLPLDETDNTRLVERAGVVLEALKQKDYTALATLISPGKGVTFTPYSTVDPDRDHTMTASQIAGLASDDNVYVWGVEDGRGDPIKLTAADYFERYVFNTDYTQAPVIGIDNVQACGNALENVAEGYPDGRFVEYYFPGLKPKMEGFDWCSLKLVFEAAENDWYLVGLIHSEWTI